MSASSTGLTSVYSGWPLPRTITKSGTLPALNVTSPRIRSVKVMSSSGMRRRTTGSRPSARKAAFCSSRQVAVEAVVAELGVAPGGEVARLDLLGRGEGLVGEAALEEPRRDVGVDLAPLALAVRAVGPPDLGPLVPVEAQPAEGVEKLLVRLLRVAFGVGVLDAEHEVAARVAGVGPVEQRRADQADVRRARGRGAEADADLVAHRRTLLIAAPPGFARTPMPSMSTSTRSPCARVDTPAGVPVSTTSPGSSVATSLTIETMCAAS